MNHLNNFNKFVILNENTNTGLTHHGKTHLMTLSEYKEQVSPLLKEYRKFLKKK